MCDAGVAPVAVTTNPNPPVVTAAPTAVSDSIGCNASGARDADNDVMPQASALTESLAAALQGVPHLSGHDLTTWLREAARTVLYVGREKRIVLRELRVALEIRDKHCTFPGCTIDATRWLAM